MKRMRFKYRNTTLPMDKLKEIYTLLEEIDELSEKIIRTAVPIMRSILKDREKIVKKAMEEGAKDEAKVRTLLQACSLGLVSDAKQIKKELDELCLSLATNVSIEDNEKLSFLREVWSGDMYNVSKVEALKRLQEDLEKQIEDCTIEKIVNKMYSH